MKRTNQNSSSGDSSRENGGMAVGKSQRDGSPVSSPGAGPLDHLESWSREDFEAALPLYVGGELDAQESARVDAWLIAHPEDQEALAASKQAAGVLARYAEFTKERETPDLWAGIRSGLLENGTLAAPAAQSAFPEDHMAPILGGPRWFQRKGVAAAAALLLTGSVGVFLMARGDSNSAASTNSAPIRSSTAVAGVSAAGAGAAQSSAGMAASSDAAPNDMAQLAGRDLLSGEAGTADLPLMSSPVGNPLASRAPRGKAQRLQRAHQGAERLIDDAPRALLWQVDPWVGTRQGAEHSGPQLTGGQ